MKNTLKFLAALTVLPTGLFAQESSIVVEPGPFDSGRLRTNTAIDFHSFNQWNGTGFQGGNVGWNSQGIWWSFLRFPTVGAGGSEIRNPELYEAIVAADSVTLDIAVLFRMVDQSLAGVVEPGVNVSFYLVPGMDIPGGDLPTWSNSWIGHFPDAIKFAEIDPATVATVRFDWAHYQESPPTEEEIIAATINYEMKSAFDNAIESGSLGMDTPWSILFVSEEIYPLLPDDPKWVDARDTIMNTGGATLTIHSGGATWGGYDIDANSNVDTGNFLGWINVEYSPWVYSYSLSSWMYMSEPDSEETGGWAYVLK